jgi:HK97 gp10 family phage protein
MAVSLKFSGGAEIARNLALLQDKMRKKILRSAAVGGAAVVKKRAKEIAKAKGIEDTGATIRNIAGKVDRSSNPDYVQINIGVRHGKPKRGAKNQDDPYYWRFNEFGTSKQAARPFMRPAFEESKEQVLEVVAQRLKDGIEKYKT